MQVYITIDFLKEMFTTGKAHGGRVRNTCLIVKYKSSTMTDEQIRWYKNNSRTHAEECFLQDFKDGKFPNDCSYDLYSNFTPCIDKGRCCDKLIDNESPTNYNCEVHIYALCCYWRPHYKYIKPGWNTKMTALKKKNISIEVLSIPIRDELLKLLGSRLSHYRKLKEHLQLKDNAIEEQVKRTSCILRKLKLRLKL